MSKHKSLTSKVSREARAVTIQHVDCATKNAIIKELHRILREKDREIERLHQVLAHFPEALRAAAIDPMCECGDKLSVHDACAVGVGVPDCPCPGFKERIEA